MYINIYVGTYCEDFISDPQGIAQSFKISVEFTDLVPNCESVENNIDLYPIAKQVFTYIYGCIICMYIYIDI
jgi:hypothetical protein